MRQQRPPGDGGRHRATHQEAGSSTCPAASDAGGRLDFPSHHAEIFATGGVPADPQFRHPRPHRPEVWPLRHQRVDGDVLPLHPPVHPCHVDSLLEAAVVRFVDTIDEVSDFFGPGVDFGSALRRVTTEAEVVWLDGHSDYGNSLETFHARYGRQLTPRTTVIITGDARNNYRPPVTGCSATSPSARRALGWLNPEPEAYWDTGDSAMSHYAAHCTSVHEVRTLRQLEQFIEN